MGQENLEVIRGLFEGLSRSREERERAGAAWHPWFDAWLGQFFHPEVEWSSLADEPDTELHRGYDATNTGPIDVGAGKPIPATGNRIEDYAVWVFDLSSDGLIVEERDYLDTARLMQQLGLGS